jgi:hypothetical protein
MLTTPERLRLPNLGASEAALIVNWNKRVGQEFVKIVIDDKEVIVPRSVLVRAALLIGSEDEQTDLIPVKQIRLRHYTKDVVLRLKRDMKQGEFIRTKITMDLPYDDTMPKSGITLVR